MLRGKRTSRPRSIKAHGPKTKRSTFLLWLSRGRYINHRAFSQPGKRKGRALNRKRVDDVLINRRA